MRNVITLLLSVMVVLMIPSIQLNANENAGQASSADSSKGSFKESGTVSVVILVVGVVATAVLLGSSVWGGLTTSGAVRKKNLEEQSKKIAGAIFIEATRGYGEKTNIDILAKLYCLNADEVIDAIAELSVTGKINISQALKNNKSANSALLVLRDELTRIGLKEGNFQNQIQRLSQKLINDSDMINKAENADEYNTLTMAEFYRELFKGK
jgi:hypothetical protein